MSRATLTSGVVVLSAIFTVLALSAAVVADDDRFPLRKKWPDLIPISTSELASARSSNQAIVVDVRTAAEYEILHIAESHHFPHDAFLSRNAEFSALTEQPHRLLVFYCNGTTCAKSYKAAEIATQLGFKGARVYDGGIFEWATAYPEETIYFGRKMTKAMVQQYVVDEEDFDKGPWLVDSVRFIEMARSGDYKVFDLRDPRERAEYDIKLPDLKVATIDELAKHLERGDFPKTRVLMLDNVGKQVIWAKYYLDQHGVKDYFFLRGGVRQWRAEGLDSRGDKLQKVFGRPTAK